MTEPLSRDQEFIRKLTDIVKANLRNENFGVKELVRYSGLSRYSLNLRLHSIINKNINQFIRETRLKIALEILQKEDTSITDVAYKVGFRSPTYFDKCFHEFFGYPPGEVRKPEPDNSLEINPMQTHVTREPKVLKRRTLFFAAASVLFIAILVFSGYLYFIKRSFLNFDKSVDITEKSIAILPFKNLSDSAANQYFIDGVMEEILNNLSRIHDLRVISRTSVEQFRGTNPASEIAKKLNVDYIVEGSGQKYGNAFRLRVQLIDASNDKHIWAESYEQEIRETKDIFTIQSRIAESIVAELKTTLTSEEKLIINKVPTLNLTAYDFYQRGSEELRNYNSNPGDTQSVKRAEQLFNKALECDSTYALAYIGLANIYYIEHRYKSFYSENYLDSVLVLAERALSYDVHLPEAYYIKGEYYLQTGNTEHAIKEYDKAIKYNPNYWQAYWKKGWWIYIMDYNYMDFVKAIEHLQISVNINRGKELPVILRGLGDAYICFTGFPEKANYYYKEALSLDGDTSRYLSKLAEGEYIERNLEKAVELYERCYSRDSDNIDIILRLADIYCKTGQFNEALKYVKKSEKRLETRPAYFYSFMKLIGFIYWNNGYKENAVEWFNKQIKISEESIRMGRYYSIDANYDLAAIFAFMGEKEKAFENLRVVANIKVCPLWLSIAIKDDPLFYRIKNEPDFQKIVNVLEDKYWAEHERVRKWLEGQGML